MKDKLAALFLNVLPNIKSGLKGAFNNNMLETHRQFMRVCILTLCILALIVLLLFIQNKYLKKRIDKINKRLRRQHDWLQTTLSSITDGVITTDKDSRVTFINSTAKELLQINEDDAKRLNINSIFNIYNEDNCKKQILPLDAVLMEGKTIEFPEGTVLVLKNEKRCNIESTIGPLKDNNEEVIGMFLVFRDITVKKDTQDRLSESYQELEALYEQIAAAEEEIREHYKELQASEKSLKISEERFRLATAGCNDGIWDYNLLTGELFYSDRFKEMLTIRKDTNFTQFSNWVNYIYEEDIIKFEKEMESHLNGIKPFFKVECRIKANSGELKWVLIRGQAVWDADGKPTRVAGSVTDITEGKRNEELIYNMAYYDTLTELPNGVFLRNNFNSRLENALLYNKHLAVIFIDIDNFKSVNDIVGHQVGDEVLKKIAIAYNDVIEDEDNLFHLGGDNFCILIEDYKALSKAKEVASKILKMSESAMIINNFEFYISSSIGISLFPEHGADIDILLKNSETAMYCAKEYGKNNYFIFDENMNKRTLQKIDMEKSLRHAIKNHEFVVYYQPQIEISSGKLIGMEALVRWNHPKLGFIPPMNFIPLTEETGLIIPIGEQILKIVCKQIKEWKNRGYQCVPIAVNISVRQFENADIIGIIDKVIKEAGIESKLLEIEITETIAMSDFEFAFKILEGLKKRGIKVSLDDFGTGYSSLNYLKKLPIDRVKIDKSFVHDLSLGACEEVIAEAVINIAHSMELSVVAEGIETEEQLELLKQKGCDIAQGYLFSKPVSSLEAEKLLI